MLVEIRHDAAFAREDELLREAANPTRIALPLFDVRIAQTAQRLAGIAVGAVALMVILWRGLPALVRHNREAAERRRQSEDYAFRQLTRALGSNDRPAAYRALLRWLERLEPGMDARRFANRYGDESLSAALTALSAAVYLDAQTAGELPPIGGKLAAARKRYLAGDAAGSVYQLPPLNP